MSNQKLAWLCSAFALVVLPVALAESNSKAVARKFIGTWRLVSIHGTGQGTDGLPLTRVVTSDLSRLTLTPLYSSHGA